MAEQDPTLLRDLEALVNPTTRGDPQSGLRWTCQSLSKLAEELGRQGHRMRARKVGELLHQPGYSLQANRRTEEGRGHPDRNAQFEHIHQMALNFQEQGQLVVSVDTRKKELVSSFKNAGQEWPPKGQPERVATHDFTSQAEGKAIPYGVYDVGWTEAGSASAPTTPSQSLRWRQMGASTYPDATDLLITADGGGSNSSRGRAYGRWPCRASRMRPACGSASVTFPRAPASGTRSSTAGSPTSPRVELHHHVSINTLNCSTYCVMMPYLPREQIEAGVVDKLKSHVPARENLEQLAKMLAEAMDSASIQWREYLDPLDRKLNEVGKRLGRLYEALETGKLGLDDLAQRTHDLKQRQDKFQTGRDEVAGRVRGRKKELVDLATVEAYAEDLQTVLSEGNLTERKTFIK
jgi:hypothetical protein